MAVYLLVLLLLFGGKFKSINGFELSYRSDGPNFEYKSLQRLETTPFIMHDGSVYRDMLTIEASKAVGQFAQNYHTFAPPPFRQPHRFPQSPQTPQFYTPPYKPYTPPPSGSYTPYYADSLDFGDSRFVRIPKDLKDQRLLADRDEHIIIKQANEEEKGEFTPPGRPAPVAPTSNSPVGFHFPHTSFFPPFEDSNPGPPNSLPLVEKHFGPSKSSRFGHRRPTPQPFHFHSTVPTSSRVLHTPPNRVLHTSPNRLLHNPPNRLLHPPPNRVYHNQLPSIPRRKHDFFSTPRKVPLARNYFNEF